MNLFMFVQVWGFQLGASGVYTDRVMEGDSVTLNTGVKTNQQEKIKWYFNNTRIAQINGDLSKICTDVQCNEGTERFRDRLKLGHQTGSLTIMNTTNTHSGEYKLQIIGSNTISETIFSMTVHDVSDVPGVETNTKSVKEGESFTLERGVVKNPNDVMTWYFNEARIAEITGDQCKICTDVQCKERFRDRLKLDHHTGSLTITHTTNTYSGEYTLLINSSSFIICRQQSISIINEKSLNGTDTNWVVDLTIGGACVGVLLVVVGVIAEAPAPPPLRHQREPSPEY
ncbi:V-set and immunoglobulin domain-containing protein 1-like [Pimephales promelas]|nr:V-set and immunoglobulin domain-containing protein 1-like [Pimephales promelas]